MNNKKYYYLQLIFSTLWLIYFIYSLGISAYEITKLKRIEWKQATNISSTYSNYKGSLITYSYQKSKIKIARTYGGLTKGLTVWAWGINKKANPIDFSFYVKEKDYNKVISNSPSYYNLWFSDIKEINKIPFFGLRKINNSPNKILLFFDLLKYNYSIIIGLPIFFIPSIIFGIVEKKNKVDFLAKNNYLIIISLIFIITLLSRFLI